MQFLKTAFWVILAVAIALFCKANNRPVDIKIWGEIVWETKIWFPILLAFLIGALPFWLAGRATKWRLKRRLESTEKALVTATSAAVTGPTVPPSSAFSAHEAAITEPTPSPAPILAEKP